LARKSDADADAAARRHRDFFSSLQVQAQQAGAIEGRSQPGWTTQTALETLWLGVASRDWITVPPTP